MRWYEDKNRLRQLVGTRRVKYTSLVARAICKNNRRLRVTGITRLSQRCEYLLQ
ncbi:hypothetical protein J6590_046871 [Homalodisca vitripennis]|nr:hypothetical protein J6590_046871 [Homalodisca vitripennis]